MTNPLDWTGDQFLQLYLALAGLAAVGVMLLRWHVRQQSGVADSRDLDMLDLAYLAGGPDRAADTVLVGLLATGVASLDAGGKRVTIDPAMPAPPAFEAFRSATASATTRSQFHQAVQRGVRAIAVRLSRRGLAPSADKIDVLRWGTMLLLAVPFMLGGAKVLVGLSRDRPVGLLVVLMGATVVALLLCLGSPPYRTQAGAAALQRYRLIHGRAARAPAAGEMALAFALAGPVILAGTPYATLIPQNQSSSGADSSSSDSSSSDGGGSDGGGDSGCGGCGGGGE